MNGRAPRFRSSGNGASEAQEILAKYRKAQTAECSSGVGKRCDGMTYTVQTWAAAVEGYEARLKALPSPRTPDAGPKRIAALLSLLPGVTKPAAQLETEVQLIAPTLLGVFTELAALSFGLFGFRQMTATAPALKMLPAPASEPEAASTCYVRSNKPSRRA